MKEFLKFFKYPTSIGIRMIIGRLDIFFNALHQERKRRNEKIPKICMVTLSSGHFSLIYKYWVCEIFIKTLIIISTNVMNII